MMSAVYPNLHKIEKHPTMGEDARGKQWFEKPLGIGQVRKPEEEECYSNTS